MSVAYELPQPGDPDAVPGDPDAVPGDLALLSTVVTRLGEDAPAHLDTDTTAQAACELLLQLRELRQALQTVEAFVEAEAAARVPRRVFRWPGYVAELKGGRDYKHWRNGEVAWAVVHPFVVDATTGEVDPAAAELVGKVRDALLNCAQVDGWRVTQLRPLGLDPTNYCETVPGRRTVHVRLDVEDEA